MTSLPDESNGEDDLFYFETDHLALRGNKDYSEVVKTLFMLCSERKKAIKDYNKVVDLKSQALEDPTKVLEKIMRGESLEIPEMHVIPEVPVIDWSQYDIKIPENVLKSIYSDKADDSNKVEKKVSPKKVTRYTNGRWTPEEQKRLEELLQVYPPEPIEMRRFKKIADALGNRTFHQVSSRVQKYFKKLYKAGLPIPGRVPKSVEKCRKSLLHKHQRHNHYLWKPTTFFPDLIVPVVMNDLEQVPGPSMESPESFPHPLSSTSSSSTTNYLLPSTSYHDQHTEDQPTKSDNELKLELLKRVRREKVRENGEQNGPAYHHIGFRCDYCSEDPIIGSRWHCLTCRNDSIDFCTDCVLSQMYSENCHPFTHKIGCYRDAECFQSSDSESNDDPNGGSDKNSDSSSSDSEDEETSDNVSNGDFQDRNGQQIVVKSEHLDDELEDYGMQEFDAGLFTNLCSNGDHDTNDEDGDNVSYKYLHSNLLIDTE